MIHDVTMTFEYYTKQSNIGNKIYPLLITGDKIPQLTNKFQYFASLRVYNMMYDIDDALKS